MTFSNTIFDALMKRGMFLKTIAEPKEPILPDPCGPQQPLEHQIFESGFVTSSNYPDFYPNSASCTWLIHTEPHHSLALQFVDFDLEPR